MSLQRWEDDLAGLAVWPVVLLPSFDEILRRNQHRSDARRLDPGELRVIYEMMEPWREQADVPVIDTTALSAEKTVLAIDALLPSD